MVMETSEMTMIGKRGSKREWNDDSVENEDTLKNGYHRWKGA